MARLALAILVTGLLCATLAARSAASGDEHGLGPDPLPVPEVWLYDQPAEEAAMVADVNAERVREGRPSLTLDAALTEVARRYAREMLAERFIGHVTPGGEALGDRLHGARYHFRVAGENLAFTTGDERGAEALLLASPAHHANMLSTRFNRFGVGAVSASVYGTMYVQEFAGD